MIKAVLFDYDDTLVQTTQTRYQALKFAAKSFYNISLTDEKIKKYWGIGFQEFITSLFGSSEPAEIMAQKYASILDKYPNQPYPHAIKIINQLLKKYQVGIVSSLAKQILLKEIPQQGFPIQKFFYVQGADDTEVHKPDPKVFLPVIEKLKNLGINQNEVVYIGDSLRDYQAAKGAGFHFLGIADHTTTKEDFIKEGADSFDDFTKLSEKIISLTAL